MTKSDLAAKFRAAKKSATVWALSLGLAVAEGFPYLAENLPVVREAFDDNAYQSIVRVTLLLGIILRVRQAKAEPKAEDK